MRGSAAIAEGKAGREAFMAVGVEARAKILVVDDEAGIVRLFVRALSAAGYTDVHGMTDPTEVPAYLDAETPDLVILDLNMPGMDGFALLREISDRLVEDAFLPVMAVSGMAGPDAKERAFLSGAKDFLAKPVDLPEFLLHVRSLLETRFLSLRLQETQQNLADLVGRRTEELQRSVARTLQAEEALQVSEEQYRLLAQTSGVSVALFSPDGTVLFLNDVAASLVGRDPEEMVGRSATVALGEAYTDRLMRRVSEVFSTGDRMQFEDDMVLAPGMTKWFLSTYTRVVDAGGGVRGVQVVSVDITERKSMEEALLLTQVSLDKAAEAVFWFDPAGRVQYVNEYGRTLYGYSREEIAALTVFDFDPGLTAEVFAEEWRMIREQGAISLVSQPRKKSGERFHAEITNRYLRHNDRELAITIVRDVTDRHAAEEALRASEERLSQMFDSMSNGVVIYEVADDGETMIVRDMNPAAERIDRVSRASAIGRPAEEVFPFLRPSGLHEILHRVWRTGVTETHPAMRISDGSSESWADNHVYKLPSGEVVAIFDDVTEKRETLERLQGRTVACGVLKAAPCRLWVLSQEYRDPYSAGHQQRVARSRG